MAGRVVKEGIDNALDACEEANIAPEITIAVSTKAARSASPTTAPASPPTLSPSCSTIRRRLQSREAYVGPTRGAQGNALQTLLAMPFALDGSRGETVIESHGIDHHITFSIDPVRREPKIEHAQRRVSCTIRHPPHAALAEFASYNWPTRRGELYKSSAASPGSTRTPASP